MKEKKTGKRLIFLCAVMLMFHRRVYRLAPRITLPHSPTHFHLLSSLRFPLTPPPPLSLSLASRCFFNFTSVCVTRPPAASFSPPFSTYKSLTTWCGRGGSLRWWPCSTGRCALSVIPWLIWLTSQWSTSSRDRQRRWQRRRWRWQGCLLPPPPLNNSSQYPWNPTLLLKHHPRQARIIPRVV